MSLNQNQFVWHDLMSTDVDASNKFFTALLGWTIEPMDMGDFTYNMIKTGDRGIGGMVSFKAPEGVPAHWIPYLEVEDVDAFITRAESLGGKLCVPATDIPNVGRFAVIEDAQGGFFSPITFTATAPETTLTDPKLGQWCWVELLTTDPKEASVFYSELVGWDIQTQEMGPMGTYYTAGKGEARYAGMMTPPGFEGRPHWLSYIMVEDVDASAAQVTDLGGTIKVPPHDIPGMGRAVQIADPSGAVVALFSSASA